MRGDEDEYLVGDKIDNDGLNGAGRLFDHRRMSSKYINTLYSVYCEKTVLIGVFEHSLLTLGACMRSEGYGSKNNVAILLKRLRSRDMA